MHCDVEKSDRSGRKIERWLFLWCSINYAESEILACYEKEKDIRKVVIKIHKLGMAGGFS